MAIADEQQRLATQFIELQKKELDELKKERALITQTHEATLQRLEQELKQRIGWSWVFSTLIASLLVAGIVLIGAHIYGKHLKEKTFEAQDSYSLLEGYNADFKRCPHDGKTYPCLRVMSSWGAYGEDRDYYIIDPK